MLIPGHNEFLVPYGKHIDLLSHLLPEVADYPVSYVDMNILSYHTEEEY